MRTTTWALLLSLATCTACTSRETREVVRSERGGVTLSRDVAADPDRFQHPQALRGPAVEELLRSLRYRRERLGIVTEEGLVFDEDEARWLAAGVVQALAQAGPSERVELAVRTRRLGAAYWADELTSGALFVEDGALHLAIGNLRRGPAVDPMGEPVLPFDGDPFEEEPGGGFALCDVAGALLLGENRISAALQPLTPPPLPRVELPARVDVVPYQAGPHQADAGSEQP